MLDSGLLLRDLGSDSVLTSGSVAMVVMQLPGLMVRPPLTT